MPRWYDPPSPSKPCFFPVELRAIVSTFDRLPNSATKPSQCNSSLEASQKGQQDFLQITLRVLFHFPILWSAMKALHPPNSVISRASLTA